MTQKIWFITGASRGFGREWTEAALKRGDQIGVPNECASWELLCLYHEKSYV